ncbi:glycosyltransferase family 39 protein [Chlorobaculum parvum]|nr:glycosyltransferase family 39 protein [Chlorobaculum parvum]
MSDFSWFRRHKSVYIVIGVLIVAGVVVRLWPVLNDRPLWYDEARTWQTAYNPKFLNLLTATAHKEHPPLSYLFVRSFMEVFGADNFMAMRLPSLVFGVLCIPAAFAVGKRLISTGAGVLFALLVALDQLMIDQSQQARMYTLFMLLLLLALLHLAIATDGLRASNSRSWVQLGLLLGALGWTHQLALVVWPGFAAGVGFFLFRKRKEPLSAGENGALKTAVLVFGTALLVDLPPLLQLLRRLRKPKGTGVSGGGLSLEILHLLSDLLGSLPVAIPVVVICVFGLVLFYRHANRSVAVTIAAIGGLTLAAQFPLAQVHHQIGVRYLVPILVVIWIGLVAAIVYSKGMVKRLTLLVVSIYVVVTFLKAVDLTFVRLPERCLYGYATDFVVRNVHDGELVVYYPTFYSNFCQPYAYLYGQDNFFYGRGQMQAFQKKIRDDKKIRGVWVVLSPKRIVRDSVRNAEKLINFYDKVADLGVPLRRGILGPVDREQPVVLYIKGEDANAWEVRAISANKAGVFTISADGFLE